MRHETRDTPSLSAQKPDSDPWLPSANPVLVERRGGVAIDDRAVEIEVTGPATPKSRRDAEIAPGHASGGVTGRLQRTAHRHRCPQRHAGRPNRTTDTRADIPGRRSQFMTATPTRTRQDPANPQRRHRRDCRGAHPGRHPGPAHPRSSPGRRRLSARRWRQRAGSVRDLRRGHRPRRRHGRPAAPQLPRPGAGRRQGGRRPRPRHHHALSPTAGSDGLVPTIGRAPTRNHSLGDAARH